MAKSCSAVLARRKGAGRQRQASLLQPAEFDLVMWVQGGAGCRIWNPASKRTPVSGPACSENSAGSSSGSRFG